MQTVSASCCIRCVIVHVHGHVLDALPAHMHAVVTTGNAGYDRLDHRLVPTPVKVIQETDFCGPLAMAGLGVITLPDRRVLIRACMRPGRFGWIKNVWMASDFSGPSGKRSHLQFRADPAAGRCSGLKFFRKYPYSLSWKWHAQHSPAPTRAGDQRKRRTPMRRCSRPTRPNRPPISKPFLAIARPS